jgi:aspartate kinase
MALIVQKFGGTSVGTTEKIKNVAWRVVDTYKKGNQVVVVVSAMGDTTDELIRLCKKITVAPPPREYDQLLMTGEIISVALVAMAIKELGVAAVSLTGAQAGVFTEDIHSKARIVSVRVSRLKKILTEGKIPVVAGFQGVNSKGDYTTIGRGGSDTSAVVLAAALEADECEIYSDVEGIYTADPRVVPEAKKLKAISYEEMLELASLGATVLHPRSVECARNYGIVLHVRSSFSKNSGTLVKEVKKVESKKPVSGVTYDTNVGIASILQVPDRPGVAAKIFGALAK